MKIRNIKINGYGSMENKEINFKDGLNIVYGKNESGKSTVMSYISNILYGISRNKDGKNLSDYERYKPWTSQEFSGKINYELDNGESYEVYRDFNKKNPKIYNEKLEDISDSYDIDKKDGSKFFIEQTGVDKQMYLSTVMSMQQEVRLDDKTQNTLVQKIANLAGTGEDNVSYKKAVDKLQEKIRDEIGTNKTTQKPINIIRNEISTIEGELQKLKPYEERQYSIDREKEKIIADINKGEKEKELAAKINSENEKQSTVKQKIDINFNTRKENLIKLEELYKIQKEHENNIENIKKQIENSSQSKLNREKELKDLEEKEEQINGEINSLNLKTINRKSYIIAAVAELIILIINAIAIKKLMVGIVGLISVIITLILYVLKASKIKKDNNIITKEANESRQKKNKDYAELKDKIMKTIEDIANKIQERKNILEKENNNLSMVKGQIMLLEKNNERIQSDINKLEQDIEIAMSLKIEEIKSEFIDNLDIEEINLIVNSNNIRLELENIIEDLNNNRIKLKSLDIEEANLLEQLETMTELKEKQESLYQQLEELKNKEETINIALQNLEEAYEEMKNTITPKFTQNLSNNASRISNGKYTKVTINDEKGLIIENQNGEYIEADKLSIGTIDELYFSLRLSMIEELSEEKLPVILDETFAYFDNERMENALKYLANELTGHQVIIFTCSNREKQILNDLELKYELINL